ncbi:winged helix-turn-helix domain-containing protein [Brevibacillus laterosporus]|uniref:winged helix-turn-helix domain-containing protein n=1 Tax=Brevibacillus laterosporus TaxID=1465 RepID=UPI000A521A3E|nr:winged helix-turn-helix domain-containing protein [Brevibacillus laterosporus]
MKRNGVEIELTKKEFDIIELLATNTGQVFSKEQIFGKIWGYDSDSYVTTVTEHIKRIRAKFMAHAQSFDCIKTVWGIGYKWEFLHT